MTHDFLSSRLKSIKEKDLYRSLPVLSSANGAKITLGKKTYLNFSSNNYLGLASHPEVKESAARATLRWGAGSGASRLISGSLKIHEDLEKRLASFKGEEAALVFSSGYLANLGVITALLDEKDLVIADRLNHASLIDAARLSKAKFWIYPHKDADALDKLLSRAGHFQKKLVVTDAYFSMDGDVAPLGQLFEVCQKHRAMLMIDEAHSTGVFGKNGRGLAERFGLSGKIDVVMGTLSKTLGSAGGFIAGSSLLREYLINRSREFIYTTAPNPAASGAVIKSLEIIEKKPMLRKNLWANADFVRNGLKSLGFDLGDSEGPIIPIFIRETRKTLLFREALNKEGIFAPAIRPPTIPKNTDRIRLSLVAAHETKDLERFLGVMKKLRSKIS